MRVRVTRRGFTHFGEYLGLLTPDERGGCDRCEGEQWFGVVRLDGFGLMLVLVHPSEIQPVTAEEEASYK